MMTFRHSPRGSSLIAVFWFIAVMGLMVFGALQFTALDTQMVTAQRGLAQARRLAEKGLALGAHPDMTRDDPILARQFPDGSAFRAVLTAEEGRVNPNTLLLNGQSQVLTRLFSAWGMELPAATALTQAMVDWVDGDDQASAGGAEAAAYLALGQRGLPFNRPFESLEEIRFVRGMEVLEARQPDWRDAFTLWTVGEVDVNSATPEVIAAVSGASLGQAQRLNGILAGMDGIRFTADDVRLDSAEVAAQHLGVEASPLLGVDGSTRHVESIGQVGRYWRKLVMITRGPLVLHRGERPAPAQ